MATTRRHPGCLFHLVDEWCEIGRARIIPFKEHDLVALLDGILLDRVGDIGRVLVVLVDNRDSPCRGVGDA
jgi:hypothetical protein